MQWIKDTIFGMKVLRKHHYKVRDVSIYGGWRLVHSVQRWFMELPKPRITFIRFYFAWFDMWIGAYYAQESDTLYIQLIPMIGMKVYIWQLRDVRWWIKNGSCATCGRAWYLTCKHDCIPF